MSDTPQTPANPMIPPGNHAAPSAQPLEKQMLELSRREKELRKREESMKGAVPLDSLKERAKSDRNSLLRELGLDDLVQEDPNDPIAALKKQVEDMQNQAKAKEREQEKARRLESLKSELASKSDEYELINTLGYHDRIFEEMENWNAEDGEAPDVYSFAKKLEDSIFQELTALKASKKLSGLFQTKPSNEARHPLDQSTTLSSGDRPSTQPPTNMAPSMTRQEMIEQAARRIKFND